jgi:ribonuclease P protein component
LTDTVQNGTNPGRLKSRPEFLRMRQGERRRGPYFILEILDRKAPEAVRLHGRFAMLAGHDYVFVGHRDALEASFEELTKALVTRIASRQKDKSRAPGKSDAAKS